jgi:hypothetical protein
MYGGARFQTQAFSPAVLSKKNGCTARIFPHYGICAFALEQKRGHCHVRPELPSGFFLEKKPASLILDTSHLRCVCSKTATRNPKAARWQKRDAD